MPREQLPLPSKPPYTAHLGNLPFDATQGDVEEFFQDCEPTNVRIVEDKIEHKPKGFGYVEFRTLDGLKKALTLDGSQFRGRSIRISVAEPRKYGRSIAWTPSLTKGKAKDRPEARELNDWTRKGPLPDLPQQRRASDRGGFKGYEAAPEMERGGSRRGASSFEGDGKVRDFNNWERKGPLTPLPSSAGAPPAREGGRVRDGAQRERKLSPSWGEGRDGSRPPRGEFRERPADRQPTPAELDNQWRARMRPDPPTKSSNTPTPEPSAPSSPAQPPPPHPAVRPKLNLQKRTVSEAEPTAAAAAVTPADSKSSPFGAARPIDTAAREREVEEKRLLQMRLKREAEEKAREEKRAKEAAAKAAAAAEQVSSPVQENGKTHEEPKENGTSGPVPGRNYQILSRVDDEGNEIEHEKDAADEPADGEVIEDKAVKPREFIREPPKGPKAQQHGGSWRRKPSASNTPTSPSAAGLEEEGWSTVPTRGKAGRGRGGNGGPRAIAS